MVLDDVLGGVMPRASSLALPGRVFSGFEQLNAVADSSSASLACASRPANMAAAPQIVAHFIAHKKHRNYKRLKEWSEWQDSNLRPLRPERSALPG